MTVVEPHQFHMIAADFFLNRQLGRMNYFVRVGFSELHKTSGINHRKFIIRNIQIVAVHNLNFIINILQA